MPRFIANMDFAASLCKAFGLDSDRVIRIKIVADAHSVDEPVAVEVTMLGDERLLGVEWDALKEMEKATQKCE